MFVVGIIKLARSEWFFLVLVLLFLLVVSIGAACWIWCDRLRKKLNFRGRQP